VRRSHFSIERNRTGVPQDVESAGEIGHWRRSASAHHRVIDLRRDGGALRELRGRREAEALMPLVTSDS
jgi:hypothetical protein